MTGKDSTFTLSCGLLAMFTLLAPVRGWAVEPATGSPRLRDHFSVENRLVYQYRSRDGDEDSDFYDYRHVRGRDLFDGQLDVYFSGRLHKDVDGTGSSQARDPFAGVEDREAGWEDQIYQLYGDMHDSARRFGLRLGRQYIEAADWLHIDGGQLRLFEKSSLRAEGFFGRPVSYYSGTSGDWTGGVSLEGRPATGSRVRVGYVRYEDDSADQDDDRYTLDVWQRFGDEVRAHGRLSLLDERFHKASLDFIYISRDGLTDAVLGIRHWGGSQGESREYSPLYSVLGELEPYTFLSGRWTVALNNWCSVSPGATFRLVESDKRDARNRQYGNYDLTLIFEPDRRWTVSVVSQYWDVSGSDRFWGLTGEVEYRPSKLWRAAVGTAYLDYEYRRDSNYGYSFENGDIQGSFDGSTHYVTTISPDAYTVYAQARIELTRWLSLKAGGEIEDNSEEDDLLYGLRTSFVVRF